MVGRGLVGVESSTQCPLDGATNQDSLAAVMVSGEPAEGKDQAVKGLHATECDERLQVWGLHHPWSSRKRKRFMHELTGILNIT